MFDDRSESLEVYNNTSGEDRSLSIWGGLFWCMASRPVSLSRRRSIASQLASLEITKRFKRGLRPLKRTYSVHLAIVDESDSSDADLTEEEQRDLAEIRSRKEELKREIQVRQWACQLLRRMITKRDFRVGSN